MAVQGKLTAQWRNENPDVEPASTLLEKIKAEKELLIKEGKIKRDKPLPIIAEEEKPFGLSENWEWCRLGTLAIGFEYGTSSKSSTEGKIPVLRMGNIQNGNIDWLKLVYSNNEGDNIVYQLQKNDLLFNRTNSRELVGKTALYNTERAAIFAGYLVRFRMIGEISPKFSNFVMNSPLHREWCEEVKSDAIGQSNINATKLRSFRFPLPPLAEQQAIVSRVENLYEQIDQLHTIAQKKLKYRENTAKALFSKINNAENDIEVQEIWRLLNANFKTLTQSKDSVKQLRQTILQLAVKGKLTKQWRNENPDIEPASVLLEKIKEEKVQLIKEGKIRREKPLPQIMDNENPYDLPKNWTITRIGEICQIKGGKRVPAGHRFSEIKTDHIYIRIRDMKNGSIVKNNLVYISNETYSKIHNYIISKDDLYITIAGTIGQVGIVPDFFHNMNLTENAAKLIFKFLAKDYLKLVLNSNFCQQQFSNSTKGMAQPKLALKRIANSLVIIPPLEEQKQIVFKVNQLMAWCDELEQKIEKRDAYQERIMQAVVKQAI